MVRFRGIFVVKRVMRYWLKCHFLMILMTDVLQPRHVQLFKQTQPHNGKSINMINISSFNSERKLRGILNQLDIHKRLSTLWYDDVGPASQTVHQH